MFEAGEFNRKMGAILKANRERLSLTLNEVGNRVHRTTIQDLQALEAGELLPRACQIYELLRLYNPTDREMRFFCISPNQGVNVDEYPFSR